MMKFKKAWIYGFGKWIDHIIHFENGHSSFICLYGENESGKSTLQQFILYMLFDLPPRKRKFYYPKRGNQFGGQLTIVDSKEGTFTIERINDRLTCLLPNGKEAGEAWLTDYLTGLSRNLYESIYSFSAAQLEVIRTMNAHELSDVLLSVGLSGATNIYKVERKLQNQLDGLFKRTGRVPSINVKLKNIKETLQKVQQYETKELQYMSLTEKLAQKEAVLKQGEQDISTCRKQLMMYEQVKQALPKIQDYIRKKHEYSNEKSNRPFPENGLKRYEKIKEQLIPLESEYQTLERSLEEYEANIRQYEEETLLKKDLYEHACQLLFERQNYLNRLTEIKEIQRQLTAVDTRLNERALHIGVPLNEIQKHDFPLHLEHEWREIADGEADIVQAEKQIQVEQSEVSKEKERLSKERNAIKHDILPETEIENITQKIEIFDRYAAVKVMQEEDISIWDNRLKKRRKIATNTLIVGAILTVMFVVLSYVTDYFNFIFVAIGSGVISSLFFLITSRSIKDIDELMAKDMIEPSHMSEATYRQYIDILNEQLELKNRKLLCDVELEKVIERELHLEGRLNDLTIRRSIIVQRIEKMENTYPFLTDRKPIYWAELLQLIYQIKEFIREKEQLNDRLIQLTNENKIIEKKVHEFAQLVAWERHHFTFIDLENLVNKYKQNNQFIEQYEIKMNDVKEDLQRLNHQIKSYHLEKNQLFQHASVQDEESYYEIAKQKERQAQLENEIIQFEIKIEQSYPEKVRKLILQKKLSSETLHVEMVMVQEHIEKLESKNDSLRRELVNINHQITELEMSEDLSKSSFQFQMEKDTLKNLAKQWAIYKVAYDGLQRAKLSYQEKFLADIMQRTTRYFKKLTSNYYVRVLPPDKSTPFQVESKHNIRYTVDELSQGTMDQLYVALRLAIGVVTSQGVARPFIIDDAFVHFDKMRIGHVIDILRDLSEEHQILLFTCRAEIAALTDSVRIDGTSSRQHEYGNIKE